MHKTIIAAVLAAVLAGALGFFGGVTYQKSQTTSFGGRAAGAGFNRQGAAGNLSSNVATGTVIAQDAKSLTVKTEGGGSRTIFISDQTEVSKQEVLKPTDIEVGDVVGAIGQQADGGIDARMVQIVPPGGSFRFGGAGGRGFGGPPTGMPAGVPTP